MSADNLGGASSEVDLSDDDSPIVDSVPLAHPSNPLHKASSRVKDDARPRQLPGSNRRRSSLTVRQFDLTELKNVVYGSGGTTPDADENPSPTPHTAVLEVQKQERARRLSTVTFGGASTTSPSPPPPPPGDNSCPPDGAPSAAAAAAQRNGSLDVDVVQTAQNEIKYNMYNSGKREYYFPSLVAPDSWTIAPLYRYLLFLLPVCSNVLIIVTLIVKDEFYGYLAYVIAPVVVVCAAMHSMSRPRRRGLLVEEASMLVLAILLPLLLTTIDKCRLQVEKEGEITWQELADVVTGIVAFFLAAVGGPFIVESARTTIAFQSEERLKGHLKKNVFIGGFSMMVSMTYLVMESGSCCKCREETCAAFYLSLTHPTLPYPPLPHSSSQASLTISPTSTQNI